MERRSYLLFAACLAAGCAFTVDAEAPDVTFLGGPTLVPSGPRTAHGASERFFLEQAPDGTTWALIYTVKQQLGDRAADQVAPFRSIPPPAQGDLLLLESLRVAHLDPPAFEASAASLDAQFQYGALFVRTTLADHTRVTVWRAGDPWPGREERLPLGSGLFQFAPRAWSYSVAGMPALDVFRLDGSFHRALPRPDVGALLAAGGDLVLSVDNCAQPPPAGIMCVHASTHATDSITDHDLGEVSFPSNAPLAIEDDGALICDASGLLRIPYDGTPAQVLDAAPCDGNIIAFPAYVLACGKAGLRAIPRDGSATVVLDASPCSGPFGLASFAPPPFPTVVCSAGGLLVVPADVSPPYLIDRTTVNGAAACLSGTTVQLRSRVVVCDGLGLRSVALDGSGSTALDPAPCSELLRAGDSYPEAWYAHDGEALLSPVVLGTNVYAAAVDGSMPPRVALAPDGTQRILGAAGFLATADPIFTRDPPDRYAQGSDGWLDDWQFMVRGISPETSLDHTRLRWLENAARLTPVGDLDSADLASREVLHLARNVRQYQEIAPGRLLVADDQPFLGPQNRLLLIDEAARTAQPLVDGVDQFDIVYDAHGSHLQLLVELVSDAGETSLALAPLPQL